MIQTYCALLGESRDGGVGSKVPPFFDGSIGMSSSNSNGMATCMGGSSEPVGTNLGGWCCCCEIKLGFK